MILAEPTPLCLLFILRYLKVIHPPFKVGEKSLVISTSGCAHAPRDGLQNGLKIINKDSPTLDVKHPPSLWGTAASFRNEKYIVVSTQGKHCCLFCYFLCGPKNVDIFSRAL